MSGSVQTYLNIGRVYIVSCWVDWTKWSSWPHPSKVGKAHETLVTWKQSDRIDRNTLKPWITWHNTLWINRNTPHDRICCKFPGGVDRGKHRHGWVWVLPSVLTCRGCSLKAWTCHSLFVAKLPFSVEPMLIHSWPGFPVNFWVVVLEFWICVLKFESVCWHFESVCWRLAAIIQNWLDMAT